MILNGELDVEVHFQPILELDGGAVTGYEALCRFPTVFGAAPDVCFAEARHCGVGRALEDHVFRRAVKHRALLPPNCFLSVNVGPDYLLSDELQAALQHQTDLAGVVFEVTEEASIEDYPAARSRFESIRQRGGLIAVDDAGSGFASLSHIVEIKPEFIKVDRRIVHNCHVDRAKSTLIEMLGAAANRLDAWIVAEGVECAGELEELLLLGVPLAQGYFLGRPAQGMTGATQAAATLIHARLRRDTQMTTLEGLFKPLSGYPTLASAEEALRRSIVADVAVVIDQWNRPTSVLQQHTHKRISAMQSFMRVQMASEPREVLQRALYRPPECRYDPVIVIAPEGNLLGVVYVDQLLHTFLDSPFLQPNAGRAKPRTSA